MNVYALQYSIAWEDKAQNQALLREQLDLVRPQPGSLVVLLMWIYFSSAVLLFSAGCARAYEEALGPTAPQ